jgi:branched-chain amino acid transport system permease protein
MASSYVLLGNFLGTLAAGFMIDCLYGLMRVGLDVIFGVMRIINFAQGDFMMLGLYVAFGAFALLGFNIAVGIVGPIVSALIAGPMLFLIGYLIDRLLVARVTRFRVTQSEGDRHCAQLTHTLGIALVVRNVVSMERWPSFSKSSEWVNLCNFAMCSKTRTSLLKKTSM